ncbi:hypothetical protein [Paracoccus tegillarcae]|nr:hypothetical protein [Paracoccus tegillarcae]
MTRWLLMILAVGVALWVSPSRGLADEPPAAAQMPQVTSEARLWAVLRLDELMPTLQAEALGQADEMAQMLFERGSDAGWVEGVAAIHQPQRLAGLLRSGMQAALDDRSQASLEEAIAFYATTLGQQIIELDLAGRRAMLDSDTEAGAIQAYRDAQSIEAPRLAQINHLLDGTDLIEQNVASGLNAALAFAQGFRDAGGYQVPMSEAEILADTWAREDEIRLQTREWVTAYLYLSYAPLTTDELGAFIDFATSDAGAVLWDVQMAGFDHLYETTSYEMGQAAALHISGQQL